jgi:hypothetical protein
MLRAGTHTLQQAASVIFALISILPLLGFAYSLYTLNAIGKLEYQLGLGLALSIALLGFYIFRVILRRMTELIGAVAKAATPREILTVSAQTDVRVPGFGAIQEFGKMADLVHGLWKSEAERHLGHRVVVSVKNSREVITGTLTGVTEEGVVLADNGQEEGIAYRRIVAIEPATTGKLVEAPWA